MKKNRGWAAAGAAVVVAGLSACVTVELPNVVSDTAKVGKDMVQAYRGTKPEAVKGATAATAVAASAVPVSTPAEYVQHTYVGRDDQTIAEIKRLCVAEAGAKLEALAGRPVNYGVTENAVVTIEQRTVANCRLMVSRG
ncbi:MAG: hypothetical protein ABW067_12975 [Rhizobacter sp.]|jgi:hypothetical protein